MSPEKTKQLLEKYEHLCALDHRGRQLRFHCDDGWFDIIDSFFSVLAAFVKDNYTTTPPDKFKVHTVKEKFGGLRIYFEGGTDPYIDGAVRLAETLSYKTCEVTGKPGTLHKSKNGWLKTLCRPPKINELTDGPPELKDRVPGSAIGKIEIADNCWTPDFFSDDEVGLVLAEARAERPVTVNPMLPKNLITHSADKCVGEYCCVHNPSAHHMRDWPMHWRDDRGIMERICPHGVGHPDPDDAAYNIRCGASYKNIHGCDGCCAATCLKLTTKEN